MNRTTVLAELVGVLVALGDQGNRLRPATTTEAELGAVAGALQHAHRLLARALDRPATNCPEHPHGPVEPGTTDGCLFCINRRQRRLNHLRGAFRA